MIMSTLSGHTATVIHRAILQRTVHKRVWDGGCRDVGLLQITGIIMDTHFIAQDPCILLSETLTLHWHWSLLWPSDDLGNMTMRVCILLSMFIAVDMIKYMILYKQITTYNIVDYCTTCMSMYDNVLHSIYNTVLIIQHCTRSHHI